MSRTLAAMAAVDAIFDAQEIGRLSRELAKANATIYEQNDELRASWKKIERLEGQLAQTQEQLAQTQESLESWHNFGLEAKDQIQVLQERLKVLEKVVIYADPELAVMRRLIAEVREQLADLETKYSRERYVVEAVQAQLFERLRPIYQEHDRLRLVLEYRRRYLDALIQQGREEAAKTAEQYQEAKRQNEREYEQAAEACERKRKDLSAEEQKELKTLWRRLVKLFHPDRYQNDPEKRAIYQSLTAEINSARDQGDLDRLREIAEDPNGFLLRQGMASLDFADDDEVPRLRRLYESLQAQILETIKSMNAFPRSAEYELYVSSTQNPNWLQETAQAYEKTLLSEIARFEQEAAELSAEIVGLTGEQIID